jgi:hypothetical protein
MGTNIGWKYYKSTKSIEKWRSGQMSIEKWRLEVRLLSISP